MYLHISCLLFFIWFHGLKKKLWLKEYWAYFLHSSVARSCLSLYQADLFLHFVHCTILPIPLSSLIIPSYSQFIISMFYFFIFCCNFCTFFVFLQTSLRKPPVEAKIWTFFFSFRFIIINDNHLKTHTQKNSILEETMSFSEIYLYLYIWKYRFLTAIASHTLVVR